jgi:hypothetical protein
MKSIYGFHCCYRFDGLKTLYNMLDIPNSMLDLDNIGGVVNVGNR